jgi:hypothetical protein
LPATGERLPLHLEILIPAHNEGCLMGGTLTSIYRSIDDFSALARQFRPPKISVHVGADACTDTTTDEVRRFPHVTMTRFNTKQGKWGILKALVAESTSDWILLVDAGTLWPENFLAQTMRCLEFGDPDLMAIAPSYRPDRVGVIARVLWGFESWLKRMETMSGGPVSLHGATVGYKTSLLKQALDSLGPTNWVNDDVVIPLTLRALNPHGLIRYPVGEVSDSGIETRKLDLGRRKRLLFGNLQWVQALLPSCLRQNPIAAIIAGRRVFRVLWAYWVGLILCGTALICHVIVLPGIAMLGILLIRSGSFRQFSGAALISLLAPYFVLRSRPSFAGNWE